MKNYLSSQLTSLIILLLIVPLNLTAQNGTPELPEVIGPSPTVANLMKFEEVPISHYTGQPNISIPLFSKSLNNELGLSLALQYNTQGIKVDNRSGWTGTGWSLFAGGSISRTVRGGIPDEMTKGGSASGRETGVLHNNDYWNYESLSGADKAEFNWKAVGSSADKYDTDLDLYQFNFLNYSGRFVIIKNNNSLKAKLVSKNHNVKIDLNYNTSSYIINSITLTDPYGYKYLFDVVELTKTQPFSGSTPQGGVGSIPASGGSNYFTVNSAWHLSKVISSNNLDLVTFNYVPIAENYTASVSRTTNIIINTGGALNDVLTNQYNLSILNPELSISYNTIQATTQKLSSIVFRDGSSASFELSSANHPETGGKYLTDIIIKDESLAENKRYTLTYATTTDTSTTPTSYRLWLTTVTEQAGTISHDYTLNYNNKNALSGFDSASDSWGYNSGIGSLSAFNEDKITYGLLSSIEYPTGGLKEFHFEHNAFSYHGDQVLTYDQYMENPLNAQTPIREEMIGGGVRIKEIIFKDNANASNTAKKITYIYDDDINASKSSGVIDAEFDKLVREYELITTKYLFGFTYNAPEHFIPRQVRYNVKEKGNNVQLSQGSYVGYRIVKMSEENNGYTIYNFTSPYEYPSPAATFNFPVASLAPNLDYRRGLLTKQRVFDNADRPLKEINNIGLDGSPNYEFSEDYVFRSRLAFKPEGCEWMQFYDHYDFYLNQNGEINIPTCGGYNLPCITSFLTCGQLPQIYTDFNSGWAKLKGTTTKDYFYDLQGNQTVTEQRQEFIYNNLNFQIEELDTYFNKGAVETNYKTKYSYPTDAMQINYSGPNEVSRLLALNKINEVITTENYKDGQKLSQVNNIYHEFETDMVLLEKTQTLKGTNTEEDRIEYKKYDSYGNPLEVKKTDGASICYVWGYNETLPVAKIVNATYAEIETVLGQGFNLNNSGLSLTQDNSLRSSLTSAQITTYTYDPLIGILSMRDPTGYTMTYEYDAFNRLKHVKDADGNILSKNEYNYTNQN